MEDTSRIENLIKASGIYSWSRYKSYRPYVLQKLLAEYGVKNVAICGGSVLGRYTSIRLPEVPDVKTALRTARKDRPRYKLILADLTDESGNSALKNTIRDLCYHFLYHARILTSKKAASLIREAEADGAEATVCLNVSDIADEVKEFNEGAFTPSEEEARIRSIIADYLVIRDFANANRYAGILKDRGYDTDHSVSRLMNEIRLTLAEWRKTAGEKCTRHIVLNWVDGLRRDELSYLPHLKELLEQNILYDNMFSGTCWTTPTMKTLFTGKTLLDDRLFDLPLENLEESALWKMLTENGYRFVYIGSVFTKGIFREHRCEYEKDYSQILGGADTDIPSTIYQYELLRDMARTDKPTFYIVHNLIETHTPQINPVRYFYKVVWPGCFSKYEKVFDPQKVLIQMHESQAYFDSQLQFYLQYYPKDIRCIFLSDHGQLRKPDIADEINMHHILFGITGCGIHRRVTRMSSTLDFPEIFRHLIREEYDRIGTEHTEDYCLIQAEDPYGDQTNVQLFRKHPDVRSLIALQYRGVVTEQDWYIRYVTGKMYCARRDGEAADADEESVRKRIRYLQTLAGTTYVDSRREPKYRYGMEVYRHMGYTYAKDNQYFNRDEEKDDRKREPDAGGRGY